MAQAIRIKGGRIYDPLNGLDGVVKDLCVEDGKIVEECQETAEVIDAENLVVFPGGVDVHTHIASPAVNAARALRPEDHRLLCCPRKPGMRSGVGHTRSNW
jgi:formylmethanofuran dehydrogenase subunit A